MKKIVAAAAAALLLAGAAFADVSFSWTGTGIVGGTSKALNSVKRTDCLGLTVSNDISGVVFDWDISGNDTAEESKLSLDTYYGWLTFGLPVGNLQVTSGKWTARYVDRINADAGDLDSDYYEAYKPGVIVFGTDNKQIDLSVAKDSDNLTLGEMSTVLAYTLADKLPGTLMIKGGIVNITAIGVKADRSATDGGKVYPDAEGYGKFDSQSGFVTELAYRQENVINFNLAWRSLSSDTFSIGAFVSPLMVEKLQATAGFTFGSYGESLDDATELAFDLRARYALSDATAITGMFNYSSISKEAYNALATATKEDDVAAMWAMVSFSHVAGDNIRFLATLQNTVRDTKASYGANLTAFTPACEIKASEKATVTAAFDIRWDNKRPYAGIGDVSLPIYVSFSL
jgi:hypothetical protein